MARSYGRIGDTRQHHPCNTRQPGAAPARKKADVVDKDRIASGLSFDEFELELETNYSGSYFLYARLKSRQRKAVYSFYQKDGQVEPIRQEIVRQLSSG